MSYINTVIIDCDYPDCNSWNQIEASISDARKSTRWKYRKVGNEMKDFCPKHSESEIKQLKEEV